MMQVLGLAPDQSMMKAPELALGWRRKQAPDQSMKIVPEPVPEPAPG